ncbi:class I SAM-dependent methyltransferase [Desulfonatronospira sp.]|uniref:class I SAM-dependent methyltransferase n=1 Tax=Desulfonatronospira sp. TaxID=1962951 RepID=UPI0025BA57F9|nr:class I SAM-dependent methyltransferase [Desulfonatronospira sp.]
MKDVDPYAKIAPLYDLVVTPFLNPVRKNICRVLQGLQVKTVVDLGCGTGRQLEMLHRYGFQTCGVDFSGAMLNKAEALSPGLKLYQGDIAGTPFPDSSFDCSILSLALHENSRTRQDQILAEALRITRFKGYLVVLEHGFPSGTAGNMISLLTHIPERLAGTTHYRNYLEFMKSGGLPELLLSWPSLETVENKVFYYGILVLLTARISV